MALKYSQTPPEWGASSVSGTPRRGGSVGFTLVEFLATVVIVAVLIAGAIYFTACYVQWARQNTDHEVYAVLNDELTRYKSNGGNVTALTAGAPIADIFAALKTPVVPVGMPASLAQQFMATNYTFPGRSLQATGNYQQYHFCGVDIYNDGTGSTSGGSGGGGGGSGVGSMSNGGAAGGYPNFYVQSTTGYVTVLPAGGTQQVVVADGQTNTALGVASSVTFWSSDASGNASGTLTGLTCYYNNLTSLNVSGLTGLTYLDCDTNNLPSLNISGLARIVSIDCSINPAITGSVSGLNTLYAELPTETLSSVGWLAVNDDGNAASGSNVAVANSKNWECDAPIGTVTPQAYPGSGGVVWTAASTQAMSFQFMNTTTGYAAYQTSGGSVTMVNLMAGGMFSFTTSPCTSVTVWPVDINGAPNGYLTGISVRGGGSSITGLSGQPYLASVQLGVMGSVHSLDTSNCPNLVQIQCDGNYLYAINASNCPKLNTLNAYPQFNSSHFIGGGTINITGDSLLTGASFTHNSDAVITGP